MSGWVGFARQAEVGQSTVEFAIIMAGLASLLMGLAALMRAIDAGVFVQHALGAASHHIAAANLATLADIFLY